jgi:diapolycopene oxygenase
MIQSNPHTKRVVVVGGGLAGLSAACTLAARGHEVTLLEKNEWVGGKAAELRQDGFRFDMGPTILTLPSVLRRVFSEAGKRMEDYVPMVPLDPQWRCFFDDGSRLDLVADLHAMKANLDRFTGNSDSSEGYERFMAVSKQLHKVSDRFFFWRSVGGIADTLEASGAFSPAVLRDVLSLRMGRTVASVVRGHVPDERAAQMMDHFTQYVGSAPDASPAVLCGIAHMQTEEGIWYPIGGTRAVPVALEKLARELGVRIETSVDVQRIEVSAGKVSEVLSTDGRRWPCDAVVSNCDSVRTYKELIGGSYGKSFEPRRSLEPACSGVVLYLGLKQRIDKLLHHNFIFSRDPHEEFEWIYRKGEPAPDPTCYVCAPAISEAAVAPAGGEALYILVHTPYMRPHHDWRAMLPKYREVILDKLEQTIGVEGIRKMIVTESALTPQDIHDRYRVLQGAIYGLASHGRFLGAFKPANRRRDVKGLYLAGGAAHPGPGMPMVLMSGWIAANSLDGDAAKPTGKTSAAKPTAAQPTAAKPAVAKTATAGV